MPIVNIDWADGRTPDQKREIARGITTVITQVAGCAPEAVTVIFTDHPRTDIAKAGKLMSD